MSYGPPNTNGQRDAAQQYLRQQIEQAGPVEQVLLLYDGAVKFLVLAKAAIERGDVQARCNANQRAMQIMAYLLDMVNPETGGPAAKSLFGIYSGLLKRMLQIDFENSATVCDELIANVRILRACMGEALASQQGVKPANGTVVAAPSADGSPTITRRGAVA